VRTAAGREVPQFTLGPHVTDEMPELLELLAGTETGPAEAPKGRWCAEGRVDRPWLLELLALAGDERALARAERAERLLKRSSREQILYEGLMDALGYKSNRLAFQQLARLVPVDLMRKVAPVGGAERERALALQALYLGAAGLLPEGEESGRMEPEPAALAAELAGRWVTLKGELRERPMGREHWHFGGTRPLNYPTRRIAAVSRIYARWGAAGLFPALVERIESVPADAGRREARAAFRDLRSVFTEVEDAFWARRFRLKGRALARAARLVGEARAAAIVVNVVVPLLLMHARTTDDEALERKVHAVYSWMPSPGPNAVTRRMAGLLFESEADARRDVCTARLQQGLHQLYGDYCGGDAEGCERCLVRLGELRRARK
jgi:hypothetical protein